MRDAAIMREMRALLPLGLLFFLVAPACADDSLGNGGQGGDGSGNNGNGNNNGFGGSTSSFAFGGSGGGVGPSGSGCKLVDLVISVDNSGSMSEEKEAMANDVFPAFANALLSVGDGLDDYRIGVIDACPLPAGYLTSGVGGPCNFASGEVWMDSSDPDLVAEFACVGDIDSSASQCSGNDDDEQPASSAAASLEPPASTGPNAGFAREDALLVVVAITDEDEQPSPGASAQEVHDRLVAIKGDVKKMVFLGIAGETACNGAYGSANEATVMKEVADLFIAEGRGVFWDLCTGQLEDGLDDAMAVIEQACGEFPPPE
jgi:hypothetical protein